MSGDLKLLRDFANGVIDENALKDSLNPTDGYDFESDDAFVNECMAVAAPMFLQSELLGESADLIDEATTASYMELQGYMIGQGMLTEAAKVTVSNPKMNVVHLNMKAQLNRLTSIITLMMARKDNMKAYKKYKLGQKIKKTNRAEMDKKYQAKASRLAKKLYARLKKNAKVAATVQKNKPKK